MPKRETAYGRGKNPNSWGHHKSGPEHPRWNAERMLNDDGYAKVRVGVDHPLADPNGYAYEHLIVWCSAGRAKPADDELLHHRNEHKTDNRLGNLELKKRVVHSRDHIVERKRDERGRLVPIGAESN